MTIHKRATKWEHGELPESLVNLARECGPKATSWNCLARSGRGGYKHVGLELEVIAGGEPAEDIAGALLEMVNAHAATSLCEVFRIDAYDTDGDRLGDVLIRIQQGGEADDVNADNMSGGARWALKALDDTHKRHMKTLEVIPQMVEMVGQCLEAMGGAVASAAQAKMDFASNEAAQAEEQHTHDKQMRLLELLAAHMSADSKTAAGRSSLADLLATMPDDVRETLREILGPLFDDMSKAVHTTGKAERAAQLQAVLERITPAQKLAMGTRLPEEWRTQLLAAWRAELAGAD